MSTMRAIILSAFLTPVLISGCASQHEVLAKQNQANALAYMKKNLTLPGIKQTATGLQYMVLKEGTGIQPNYLDVVYVYYRGYFPDTNKTFDETPKGQPARFGLSQVIKGWQEGIALMKEGGVYRFYVPPHLAYGDAGMPPLVGPRQLLAFDVQLVKVEKYRNEFK